MGYHRRSWIWRAPRYLPSYAALASCLMIIGYHHGAFSTVHILGLLLLLAAPTMVLLNWPRRLANCPLARGAAMPSTAMALILGALLWGIVGAALYSSLRSSDYLGGGLPLESIQQLQGNLMEDSRPWGGGGSYRLQIESLGSERAQVMLRRAILCQSREWQGLSRGQRLKAQVEFQLPPSDSSSPSARRSAPQCWLHNIETLERADSSSTAPLLLIHVTVLSQLRRGLRDGFSSLLDRFPKPSAQLLKALLLGMRQELSPPLRESFRKAGVTHLLALSGMHLAILVSLVGVVLRFLCNRRWTILLLLVCSLFYLWLIGTNPSLERAVIMFSLWSLLALRGHQTPAINIISLAFLILTVAHPEAVTELSFQLSFAALTGIVLWAAPIAHVLQGYLPRWLALSLSASLAAQLSTLPLLMLYFDAVHPIGIVATIILSPLVAIYMWQAILWLPLMALSFPYLAEGGAISSWVLFELIRRIAQWLAAVPSLTL